MECSDEGGTVLFRIKCREDCGEVRFKEEGGKVWFRVENGQRIEKYGVGMRVENQDAVEKRVEK